MVYQTNQNVIAHNDGGHPDAIYDISLIEKKVNRTVHILNAPNEDWEEIAQDSNYFFVGDFGNNKGKRTDLKIYKLSKNDFHSSDSINAEVIEFQYPDQTSFSESNDHNFDCEAMISWGDSLLLFSKNRGDLKTKLYSVSKTTGNHTAILKGEFDIKSQVTAADYYPNENVIALLSYEYDAGTFHPFVTFFYQFENNNVFEGKNMKYKFPFDAQFESMAFGVNGNLYFGHEAESGGTQYFYQTTIDSLIP